MHKNKTIHPNSAATEEKKISDLECPGKNPRYAHTRVNLNRIDLVV
jgi:hypothetical protein